MENLAVSAGGSADSIRRAFSTERARSSIGSAILNRKVLDRLAEIVQGDVGADDERPSPEEAGDSAEDAPVSAVEVDSEESTPQVVGSGQPDEAQSDRGGTPQ